ncbi:hypothetical protein [Microvirga thermotolerans]|nr:hypothetical protein [Microvirga thermotolerans]
MIALLVGLVVGSFTCLVVPPAIRMIVRRREIRAATGIRPIAFG